MNLPKLSPRQIQSAMRCAASCDARLTEEDWLRVFWYEENWSEGVVMAKFDNGAGDHAFLFFQADGKAIIKGFDHESGISPHAAETYAVWPGIYDGVPADLLALLQDVSVEHEDVTFCCWSSDGLHWQGGSAVIPEGMHDGADWILPMLQLSATAFIEWAKSYYEDDFDALGEDGVRQEFAASDATLL